jgi:hypothetical protein
MYCANLKEVLTQSDLTRLSEKPLERVIRHIGKLMLTDRPRPPGPESS